MSAHVEFVVLATTRTGENSIVLHTLSEEFGRRSFIVTAGPKAPQSLLQPLALVDAEACENTRSDLWRIRSLQAVSPLSGLRSDVRKSAISLFLGETLFRTVRESCYEPGMYLWLRERVLLLDAMEQDFANFHLMILLELAQRLGYEPSAESLSAFAGERQAVLSRFVRLPFAEAMLLPLTGKERGAVAETLISYISCHSESRIEVRSLKVLSELFV